MDGVDAGTVTFQDRNLADLRERELADLRRTKMGFVFQQPAFLKNLNLIDNIVLPSFNRRTERAAALVERARSLLARTGIAELENREPTKVSGGQLQRAGICRALMGSPKVVFGDEPTGALNSAAARGIMALLADINREGTAVVLVTHDASVAAWSDRVLFMRDGRLVSELAFPGDGARDDDRRTDAVREKLRELGM
jgi:putative ABC transport system ATP-binding protein